MLVLQPGREELKEQIDEFMQQYANEEIDGDTYAQKMMELTTSAQNDNNLVWLFMLMWKEVE